MAERDFYLGFALTNGIGPKKFLQLLKVFKTAKKAWSASESDLLKSGIGPSFVRKLVDFRDEFDSDQYSKLLKQKDCSFVAACDEEYPKLLKGLVNPPIVLFTKGDKSLLQGQIAEVAYGARGPASSFPPASARSRLVSLRAVGSPSSGVTPRFLPIAIVGTRKITNYGETITKMFATDLAMNGFTIVSGLAMGVDAVAGWSAIHANSKTIAVLGNGVDLCFPSVNKPLYDKIVTDGGIVMSEFPLGETPTKGSFPSRNRIIAGLSLGVLVTEGAADSGSIITAEEAFKLKRPVFAVPGPVTSSLSVAPLKLIEKGAKLVTSAEDILKELKIKNSELRIKTQRSQYQNLSKDELKIVQLLENEGLSFDEIVRRSNLDSSEIGSLLSMMEIKGIIKNSDGLFQLA
jgi:DNA processing protein